jgi:hypothetical protein
MILRLPENLNGNDYVVGDIQEVSQDSPYPLGSRGELRTIDKLYWM